ncbi:hypothetical protein ACQP1W_45535 [Spirillospora sp. CA-255316]
MTKPGPRRPVRDQPGARSSRVAETSGRVHAFTRAAQHLTDART